MIIGLISDTHGYLDPLAIQHLKGSDEIWHLGDIGDIGIIDSLHQIAPTLAVYGNIDDLTISSLHPENHLLEREGLLFLLTHITGKPLYYTPRVRAIVKDRKPDAVICGHSHIVKVVKSKSEPKHVYINPGAAGKQGFHHMRTIMKMEVLNKKITNLELIELGKR